MIVEAKVDIEMGGLVTETLTDNLGSTYNRIIKDGMALYDLEANQSILKGRDYSNNTFINCKFNMDIKEATENLKGLSVATVKPRYVVNKITDVSSGIHPIQKERKMSYANGGIVGNPCREVMFDRDMIMQSMFVFNEQRKLKSENTNWKFKSASDADINWKDIKDSVDYAEPLALITRNYKDYVGNDTYVVVSKELMNKAKMVRIKTPEIAAVVEKRVFCVATNFAEWVDWAKAVKAASWPDPLKSTISVVLPTV